MPRYHFDLIDHTTVEDKGGQLLADDVVAAQVANRLAEELCRIRPELRGRGYSIRVNDARGQLVHEVPIATSPQTSLS